MIRDSWHFLQYRESLDNESHYPYYTCEKEKAMFRAWSPYRAGQKACKLKAQQDHFSLREEEWVAVLFFLLENRETTA